MDDAKPQELHALELSKLQCTCDEVLSDEVIFCSLDALSEVDATIR